MTVAVTVEELGKRYRIGDVAAGSGSLKGALSRTVRAPFRRRAAADEDLDTIWAVRNVSFDVMQGETVGIIGRNGAGKSTLLRMLARITAPTEGRAVVYGDVGSLLEVGTGFHPELTGRENIYLNGAILGLSRYATKERLDDIVEFAGVDRFIDTPIKRYSSGMKVRLAFAVAAHLEPEVMLVDEVLAVGDIEFQKKCLGRMEGLTESGRTILFVSHSVGAVLRICPRVILLDEGRVVADGPAQDVIHTYLDTGLGTTAAREWPSPLDAPGDDLVRLKSVRVLDEGGRVADDIDIRSAFDVEVEYWILRPESTGAPLPAVAFRGEDGTLLFMSMDHDAQEALGHAPRSGTVRSVCRVPGNLLAEGQLMLTVSVASLKSRVQHLLERDVVAFHVTDRSEGDGTRGSVAVWPGMIRPKLDWRTQLVSDDVQITDAG